MMRKCHLNTCPVGVATQDPVLRRKFEGKPEHVVNYFFFVAEEARELMAQLGVRKRRRPDRPHRPARHAARASSTGRRRAWISRASSTCRRCRPRWRCYHCETQDHGLEKALDNRLIELARPALERGEKVTIETPIRNINRTVGTMLSDEIAKRYGHEGLPDDTIHVRLAGSAGQSFGAFLAQGRDARPDRRHQRLLRQGPVGRAHLGAALAQVPRRADREHHHRQRGALRRDRGRGLFPRRRGRALRGAQFRRAGGGRGRGRPRLRVHDRRHGGGARRDRAQLRRRHVGRHRLRARRRRRIRQALQRARWWTSSRCWPNPSRGEAARDSGA